MFAQLRWSARKRKNMPIVAAASASKKANQRVPATTSVPAPQLPTVDSAIIPAISSAGIYPMLYSQTGAGLYNSAGTCPVASMSTANTPLYSRVPDQRELNTVTSQDPPEHSLDNTNGTSNLTMPLSTLDHPIQIPSMHANITFNVSQSIREKNVKSEFIDLGILLTNNTRNATQNLFLEECILYAHVCRLQELLKYVSVVRLGAKRNLNILGWKLYDEQFRLRKALDPASSWAIVDPELWLLNMADSNGTHNSGVVSSRYNAFSANRNLNRRQQQHTRPRAPVTYMGTRAYPNTNSKVERVAGKYPSREAAEEFYEVKLFKAAFSLAYHNLLRIGELAVSNGKSAHIISITDVSWSSFEVLKIRVPSSKTDHCGTGALITFQSQPNSEACPCKLIKSFLVDIPPFPGALFCHYNGAAVTRYQFITVLKKSLERVGVNYKHYSSHSFRIGCATSLSLRGVPDAIIMKLVRLKSNAYKT
ncbi:unnamed protein product [Mytilus coruscus]|uniref:Tyr recombinase domain-containing protein n=1 Tax=Mytilus coruscus TaxID=42192 RepID=A0A6J8C420_MYTCO|nr:unnamed protein product [Mytilus coruscus]